MGGDRVSPQLSSTRGTIHWHPYGTFSKYFTTVNTASGAGAPTLQRPWGEREVLPFGQPVGSGKAEPRTQESSSKSMLLTTELHCPRRREAAGKCAGLCNLGWDSLLPPSGFPNNFQ